MESSIQVVAVIPAHNEADTIKEIARKVQSHVDMVIVVDDGSADGTSDRLFGLNVCCISNHVNLGKGPSLCLGFAEALKYSPKLIVTLDSDGQHNPEEIPCLLETARKYPDFIIIGARDKNTCRAPKLRRFANHFADFWISWAAGYPVRDSQSGYRVYPASFLRNFKVAAKKGRGFVLESEILIAASEQGFLSHSIAVESIYHEHGRKSHYRPVLDTVFITLMVAKKIIAKGLNIPGLLRTLGLLDTSMLNK